MKLKKIENAIVHCKTQEEAEALINGLEVRNHTKDHWIDYWGNYRESTCYRIENGKALSYCDIHFYEIRDYEITEFSDLIEQEETPKLTAEEVIEWLGDYYGDEEVMNEIFGKDYSLYRLCRKFTPRGVVEMISRWKSEHEKKEPEIETVDICRIIEIQPDGRKRCVHEEDIVSELPFGGDERQIVQNILKRYLAEHDGEFIAVHEVVSRVKKD